MRYRRSGYQAILRPPSTVRIWPVTNGASQVKNITARSNVRRRSLALQWSAREDALLARLVHTAFRPEYRPGSDRVDAHGGSQLPGQRARQHDQAGLRHAVHDVISKRALAMDIDDVQHRAASLAQCRRRCLRQEQRRAQIRADQILPALQGDLALSGVG